jgi:hypothetical protein
VGNLALEPRRRDLHSGARLRDGLGSRINTATITDDDCGADSKSVDVVVYVPGAGFEIEATGLLQVDRAPDVRCPPDDAQPTTTLDTLVGHVRALNMGCTVSATSPPGCSHRAYRLSWWHGQLIDEIPLVPNQSFFKTSRQVSAAKRVHAQDVLPWRTVVR